MNYYVFQYATGMAAATALSDKILHGTPEDLEAYLNYLRAGRSDAPIEVMKKSRRRHDEERLLIRRIRRIRTTLSTARGFNERITKQTPRVLTLGVVLLYRVYKENSSKMEEFNAFNDSYSRL